MTWPRLVIALFTVFLSACQTQNESVAYNSEVVQALKQRDETLKKNRTALQFESGASVQTCEAYLRVSARDALKEGVANQLAKSEYLVCDVLALAGGQKLVKGQAAGDVGPALAERADLRSFPSSLRQMLDEKKRSLSQIGPAAVTVDATSASYDTDDWHYRLELVATLDANGNGQPDWVLWLADEARDGNYRHYQTLVVYDVPKAGWLRAIPYPGRHLAAATTR